MILGEPPNARSFSAKPEVAHHPSRSLPTSDGTESGQEEKEEEILIDEVDNPDGKIRKPVGEAGRPGRGGYNLQAQLNWPALEFERVKVCAPQFIPDQHLILP